MNCKTLASNLIILFSISIRLLSAPAYNVVQNDYFGCQSQYQDLNGDGKPEEVILTGCSYSTDRDAVIIFDRNGELDSQKAWQDSVDFSDDLWVFDPGSRGQAGLIIDFHPDGSTVIADLYDDQDGDGRVAYAVRGNQPVVTESGYPTVRVIGRDGWWTQGAKTNFNLDILIDGKVRGDFVSPAYLDRLKSDGVLDFKIQIRDDNDDGRPEYDLRQAFSARGSDTKTSLMVNPRGDEKPPVEGSIFWPYLGKVIDFIKLYGQSPAPIMVNWQAAKIVSVSEFVASRGSDHNWFIYSIAPFARGESTYANFENPFAFYDLAADQDGYPELEVRSEYVGKNDPVFLSGTFPQPVENMRYSWDQDNNRSWDYNLALIGKNTISDEVILPVATVRTIPYDAYPNWVVQQKWDAATFVADETGIYWSSEGIYEGYSRTLRDEYITGLSPDKEQVLADLRLVKEGQRQEFNNELLAQVHLYITPVDGKLHLYQASEGIWNLGGSRQIVYKDLNQDGFIDSWSLEYNFLNLPQGNDIQKSLVLVQGRLIYWDGGRIRIRQANLAGSSALLLPPTDNSSWQDLGKQLQAARLDTDPQDFAALLDRWSGADWEITGAQLSDFRLLPGGFRFLLELNPGSTVTGTGGPNFDGLQPGKYLVEYSQDAYRVQAVTPAKIQMDLLSNPPNTGAVFDPLALQIQITNPGLEDQTGLTLSVEARNDIGVTNVLTRSMDLLAGNSIQVSADWQPMSAGAWVLQARLVDPAGSLLGEAQTGLAITQSDLGKPASIVLSTSPGMGLPVMGLLAAAALICGAVFYITWSKENN